MPVRYDIAAGVPQQLGGGFDPINMMAQMQAMGYRQQQNALAQMQMDEYRRKMQIAQQIQGLGGQFNVQDPSFQRRVWAMGDPELALRVEAQARADAAQQASAAAQRAAAGYHTGMLNLAQQRQRLETPGISAEAREKSGKAIEEDIKSAQRLVAPAFMARDPETFAAKYAQVYPDLPEKIQKRLGPRPTMQDLEAFLSTPETIAEARKPMLRKPGEVVVRGTGREGEYIETEPTYAPNAMASAAIGPTNAFPDRGRMQPIAGAMNAPPVDPIIAKQLQKQEALRALPPGPARETAGARMDIRDTFDLIDSSLTGLAEAGGIPRAGASSATNWKAAFRKSATGQALGSLSDTDVNARLGELRAMSGVLKGQLRKGLEMGITQLDAAREVEKMDAAFLNPDKIKGLSEGYAALDALRKMLGGAPISKPAPRLDVGAPATRGKAGESAASTGELIDFGSLK